MEVFMNAARLDILSALQKKEMVERSVELSGDFADSVFEDFLTHFSNMVEMPGLKIPSFDTPVVVCYPFEVTKIKTMAGAVLDNLGEMFSTFAAQAGNKSFVHTVNWKEIRLKNQPNASIYFLEIRAWLKGSSESLEKKVREHFSTF